MGEACSAAVFTDDRGGLLGDAQWHSLLVSSLELVSFPERTFLIWMGESKVVGLGRGFNWTGLIGLSGSTKPRKGAGGQFIDIYLVLFQKDDSHFTPAFVWGLMPPISGSIWVNLFTLQMPSPLLE